MTPFHSLDARDYSNPPMLPNGWRFFRVAGIRAMVRWLKCA